LIVFLILQVPNMISPRSESRCCAKCDAEFSFISRGTTCVRCAQRFCKKCFGKLRSEDKCMRICDMCLRQQDYAQNKENNLRKNVNPLQIGATEGEILYASNVRFRGSLNKPLRRYFVVRKDFCLYSYASDSAENALAMLPLPGCEVKMSGERLTFTIKHMERQYTVSVDNEQAQIKWMAVLDLASNAVLREKTNL
uniref:FYVE-type domain-containing protein n=1 Tax=Gongylonema pulchrum TaxID=637853 RepID=A0A183CVN7_9BILA